MPINTYDKFAFVIGGGPSLRGFDFDRIRSAVCYGANKAAYYVPDGYLVSIDRDFCREEVPRILPFGERARIAPPSPLYGMIGGAKYYRRTKARSLFDSASDELPGLNSGFAALALAIRDGHKDIGLLGVDMTPTGHFHGSYEWSQGQKDKGVLGAWIDDFEQASVDCRARGINVINFSPESAIQGFTKRPLSEI